jgi:N-methylhydantoinase A
MGVLVNDLQADFSRTRMTSERAADCINGVDSVYRELEDRARAAFARQAAANAQLRIVRTVDARYAGQNHELTVDVPPGGFDDAALVIVKANFHAAHREMFGYDSPDKLLELVTFRVRARMPVARADFAGAHLGVRAGALAAMATRKVYFDEAGGFVDSPVYARDDLRPGDAFKGPAIVEQMDCTTVVPPDFSARVDVQFNLVLKFST